MFLIIFILGAAVWLFMPSEQRKGDSLRLVFPKNKKNSLTSAQEIKKYQKAEYYFTKDNYSDYLKSQSNIVQAIESNYGNAKYWAMLCVNYLELWPYSRQDGRDLSPYQKPSNMLRLQNAVG